MVTATTDHRGGAFYTTTTQPLGYDDDTSSVEPIGTEREVEYFFASDARLVWLILKHVALS